jgi:phosphoribosylglycinamide formyltransferase-1
MRLAVLLSGRGSNFSALHQATVEGRLGARIAAVLSNRPDAPGLTRARELGYETFAIDHKTFANRASHEAEVVRRLESVQPDLVVLAGYMRLLSASFIERFRNRILNIHPSLLPAFPGIDAQQQAFDWGVKVAGCSVHFVDEHLDAGPIVLQRAIEVREDDTAETLAARILAEEHIAYAEAIEKLRTRRWRVEGRRVVFE